MVRFGHNNRNWNDTHVASVSVPPFSYDYDIGNSRRLIVLLFYWAGLSLLVHLMCRCRALLRKAFSYFSTLDQFYVPFPLVSLTKVKGTV